MHAAEAEVWRTFTMFPSYNPVPAIAPAAPHTPPMPRSKIDATLDPLTAEELADAHRFVEEWERAGYKTRAEAAAWRERIARSQDRHFTLTERFASTPLIITARGITKGSTIG